MPADIVSDPAELADLFNRHRDAHLYGLADLAEPIWGLSTWWRRGDATVGLIGLPGVDDAVVYAVSPADPHGTLNLLAELAGAGSLTDRFVVTGPVGLVGALSQSHRPVWSAAYQKMAWRDRQEHPANPAVRRLGPADAPHVSGLRAADPGAGGFFHPGLLEIGPHVGWFEAGRLVSMAGVHVADHAHGVVAVGNVVTHPGHRGRGLAGIVMTALLAELRAYPAVGLNVAKDNAAAIRLYESLGFAWVHDYDEAELTRPHG